MRFLAGHLFFGALVLSVTAQAQNAGPLPAPTIKLAEPAVSKDWIAGCDNGLSCEAVALQPSVNYADFLSFVVSRAAGIDAPVKVRAFGSNSKADGFRILIDGRNIISGKVTSGDAAAIVEGGDAIRLVRAMARGREIRLLDGKGVMIGRASLSGVRAALLNIDKVQGRTGSRSALILTGAKKMRAQPPSVPVIIAKRIKESSSIPDTSALVALAENSACAAERVNVSEDAVYSLGSRGDTPLALALINCGGGAYNPVSIAYLGTKSTAGKWTFEQARFDYEAYARTETGALKQIFHPSWNPASQTLSSFAKDRGVGDCGNSAQYIWDGSMFRLTSATKMSECAGSLNWIPTWRAQVRFVD